MSIATETRTATHYVVLAPTGQVLEVDNTLDDAVDTAEGLLARFAHDGSAPTALAYGLTIEAVLTDGSSVEVAEVRP